MATAPLIEVTSLAAEKLQEVIKDHGEDGSLLRVMVMPGQNGGMQYVLGVEKEAKDDDFVIETDTIQVLIDTESATLIEGAQIDYVEGLMRSGFVISNPNLQGAALRRQWRRRLWRRRLMAAVVVAEDVDAGPRWWWRLWLRRPLAISRQSNISNWSRGKIILPRL